MARYRVISLDLRTGTRIAELELQGLRYSQTLSGVGTVTGRLVLPPVRPIDQVPLVLDFETEDGDPIYVEIGGEIAYLQDRVALAARTRALVLNDAVDECRRHLFVERDGQVVADGIVWESPYDDNSHSRTVRASSTGSYLYRRVIAAKASFAGTDMLAVVRSLVTTMQASSGGNIGISVGAEVSGVPLTAVWERFDYKVVGEVIADLAAADTGFDWAIDCTWDPATGAPIKRLNLAFPRRGRNFRQSGHVFELGRNMTSFRWPSSGRNTANRLYGIGDGMEDAMVTATVTDATQIAPTTSGGPGYPLLERVMSRKQERDAGQLRRWASGQLVAAARPVTLPEITVRADSDPVLGSYMTGDACRIIVPPNLTPRFPEGLDTFRRIVGFEVDVSDEGAEEVTLTLGEEPDA